MYAKIIPSLNCFLSFQPFFNHFQMRGEEKKKRKPENVFLSCYLSMNEIIISHEKISSENKSIIGTSIFIMPKACGIIFISIFIPFAVDIASFRAGRNWQPNSFVCLPEEEWKLLWEKNFYYLVIRYVLLGELQTHNIMIILFARCSSFHLSVFT